MKFRILLAFPVLFLPVILHAAPSYTVAPLVINEETEARGIIQEEITLTNTGTQMVTLYPSVNNISIDEGGTMQPFVHRVESDAKSSLSGWIEIRRGGINLKPGEATTVPVTFRIHPYAVEGTYHAMIGFGYGRTSADAERMVWEGKAPGVLSTITVVDNRNEVLQLSQFIVDRFITSNDNSGVAYSVTNPGETPLTPEGEIIFYNSRGIEVGETPVNPEGKLLEPGETMEFTTSAPTEGLFGRYKGYLNVEYGDAQLASVQDTTFFYIVPLQTVIMIFGGIIVLTIVLSYAVHRRYFDQEEELDSDRVPFYVRDSISEERDHDIDLKSEKDKNI